MCHEIRDSSGSGAALQNSGIQMKKYLRPVQDVVSPDLHFEFLCAKGLRVVDECVLLSKVEAVGSA